jgi:hypothetical protein
MNGWKRSGIMNFNDRKTRRIIAIVVILVIVAMVATTIIPYLSL